MGENYLSIKITEDQAVQIAYDAYGIRGEAHPLPGELDFNFKIKSQSESYLMKVSRPGSSTEHIEFQQSLLQYINTESDQVNVPVPIPDTKGNPLCHFTDPMGEPRIVRMLSWIEGRLWSEVNPVTHGLLISLGEETGKLTRALSSFDHPMAHREFQWDLGQAGWTLSQLHLFTGEQQELVTYFQHQYQDFHDEYQVLRRGVVHNDANDNNVVVSSQLIDPHVEAIIDFGDAIHTQVINDLAITIAYAVMNKPDVLQAAH